MLDYVCFRDVSAYVLKVNINIQVGWGEVDLEDVCEIFQGKNPNIWNPVIKNISIKLVQKGQGHFSRCGASSSKA